jgi:hypothetical protein
MSLLKPVTPEEAKRVWVAIPNRSSRRVAKALTQSGRRVHHSTIARWRAEDWRPVAHNLHARQAFDMAARVLTGDPVAGLKVLSDEGGRQQELEGLSDRELLRKASREMLIAIRLVPTSWRHSFHASWRQRLRKLQHAGISASTASISPKRMPMSRLPRDRGAWRSDSHSMLLPRN